MDSTKCVVIYSTLQSIGSRGKQPKDLRVNKSRDFLPGAKATILCCKSKIILNNWKENKESKILRTQTTFGIENLGIDYIDLDTYEQETLYKKPNDTSLKWTKTYINKYRVCNTMMVSDDRLTESGILRLAFHFEGWGSHDIYVHQQGLLFSDLPDAYSHSNLFMGGGYSIPVRYELEQLLKYDGKPCNNNKEYKLDECQHDYIRKVTAENYVTENRILYQNARIRTLGKAILY